MHINKVSDTAAIFVYIMWPWRHFRRHSYTLTTDVPCLRPCLVTAVKWHTTSFTATETALRNFWSLNYLKIYSDFIYPDFNCRVYNSSLQDTTVNTICVITNCRSQWPRGLRRRYAAARLLRLWVRIPPGMFVCCEFCVLSGRGLCDELIARSEESYRLWCVFVCDLETLWMRKPWPNGGWCAHKKI